MKKIKTLAVIILMASTASCEQEVTPQSDPTISFKPSFCQIAGDDACAVEWETGDSLSQWYSRQSAIWSVIYPFSKLHGTDPTWVSVCIPSQQRFIPGQANLKASGFWTAISDGTSESLLLNPGFAVMKLFIDATGTVLEDKTIDCLRIKADSTLTGNGVVDIPADRFAVKPVGKTLELSPSVPASMSSPVSVYASISPTTVSHLSISVPCSGKMRLNVELDERLVFARGECRTVNLPIAQLLKEGKAKIDVERTDLSEKETSNCYIVSKPGFYKFKATRGNSDIRPSKLSKVNWLWRDSADSLIDDIELSGDYVTFYSDGSRGNTVIAGFDEKGDIVWSWHIWLTDDPSLNFGYGRTTDYILLDRNLGATSASVDSLSSYGLLYQWGRKDPIIGSAIVGQSEPKNKYTEKTPFISGSATAFYKVNPLYANHDFSIIANTEMPDGNEIDYLTAHPMYFVTGETWFFSKKNQDANKGAWGWTNGKTSVKSVYDPCPPGWKLPVSLAEVEMSDLNFEMAGNQNLYGMMYSGAEARRMYFPAAGSRDNSGGYLSYVGANSKYWGAMYREKTSTAWAMFLEGNPKVTKLVSMTTAIAGSIRCVND